MDRAAKSQKGGRQDLLPVGRMLVAEHAKHGVQVSVNPFNRVRLRVVGRCEGESDAGPSESFLLHLGPEVRGVVGVYLQRVAEPCVQHLQSAQYLFAGHVAERYGLKPFAVNTSFNVSRYRWPSELARSGPRISILQT